MTDNDAGEALLLVHECLGLLGWKPALQTFAQKASTKYELYKARQAEKALADALSVEWRGIVDQAVKDLVIAGVPVTSREKAAIFGKLAQDTSWPAALEAVAPGKQSTGTMQVGVIAFDQDGRIALTRKSDSSPWELPKSRALGNLEVLAGVVARQGDIDAALQSVIPEIVEGRGTKDAVFWMARLDGVRTPERTKLVTFDEARQILAAPPPGGKTRTPTQKLDLAAFYAARQQFDAVVAAKASEPLVEHFQKAAAVLSAKMPGEVAKHIQVGWGLGISPPATPKPGVSPRFDLVNKQAQEWLTTNTIHWVGQHVDDHTGREIAAVVKDSLGLGLGRVDTAKAIKARLGPAIAGQYSDSRWELVASSAMTKSVSFSSTYAFEEAGLTHYRVSNPEDEVTCPICGHYTTMRWDVQHAVAQRDKMMAAKTPEDAKNVAPWLPAKTVVGKGTADLVALGVALPPYHGRCRCQIDVDEEEIVAKPVVPLPEPPLVVPPPVPKPAPPPVPKPEPVPVPKPAPVPKPEPTPKPAPVPVPKPEPVPPPVAPKPAPVVPPPPSPPVPAPVAPKPAPAPKPAKQPKVKPQPAAPSAAAPVASSTPMTDAQISAWFKTSTGAFRGASPGVGKTLIAEMAKANVTQAELEQIAAGIELIDRNSAMMSTMEAFNHFKSELDIHRQNLATSNPALRLASPSHVLSTVHDPAILRGVMASDITRHELMAVEKELHVINDAQQKADALRSAASQRRDDALAKKLTAKGKSQKALKDAVDAEAVAAEGWQTVGYEFGREPARTAAARAEVLRVRGNKALDDVGLTDEFLKKATSQEVQEKVLEAIRGGRAPSVRAKPILDNMKRYIDAKFHGSEALKRSRGLKTLLEVVNLDKITPNNIYELSTIKLKIGTKDRAFASKHANSIEISNHTDGETIAHEFGHHLEYRGQAKDNLVFNAWLRKTALVHERELKRFGGRYEKEEVAFMDLLPENYAAKVYSYDSTELTSMMVQQLVSSDGNGAKRWFTDWPLSNDQKRNTMANRAMIRSNARDSASIFVAMMRGL